MQKISFPYDRNLDKYKWVIINKGNPATVYDGVVIDYELWSKFMNIQENQDIVNEYKKEV